MSRVFVVQEPLKKVKGKIVRKMDLRPAEEYGDIVFILDWDDHYKMDRPAIIWKLRAALADFHSADYILPLGSPSIMGLAIAIALENTNGLVKTLEWDNAGYYRVNNDNLHAQPL